MGLFRAEGHSSLLWPGLSLASWELQIAAEVLGGYTGVQLS